MNVPPPGSRSTAPQGVLDRAVGRSIFGHDAELYDRVRSGYPAALYEAIEARLPPNPRVLEIGSGTGLATRGLATFAPARLVLVEPDPGMADFLQARFPPPDAEVVCAPFLDARVDGAFDVVACAAAFHWLDPDAAFPRIAQLLDAGGICALWWNSYFGHGLPDPFGEAVMRFLVEEEVALPPSYVGSRHYAFDTAHHICALREAGFAGVEDQVFSAPRTFDAVQARDLYATFSFIEVLEPDRRERILAGIGRIVDEQFAGNATAVCATALYSASVQLSVP